MNNLYTCEWCWFKVFSSDYQICPICRYQNSLLWIFKPFLSDANNHLTLLDFQNWTLKNIPSSIKEYNVGNSKYYRNYNWKPIDIGKLNLEYDYFPKYYLEEINKSNTLFYRDMLTKFHKAQKYNPDEKVHINF